MRTYSDTNSFVKKFTFEPKRLKICSIRMRTILFLFFIYLVTTQCVAQNHIQHKRDSLRIAFKHDSIDIYEAKPVTLYLALDFRNAYIGNRFLSFVGPQAGVILNSKHIVGFSFYFLNKFSPFQSDKISVYSFQKIDFISAFYQYILYNSKHFDILIPVEIGYGRYKATKENTSELIESNIVPIGVGFRCVILPHKWVGLKVGGGYNYIWEKNNQIGLGGLNFAIGIKIDLRQLYLDYRFYHLKQSHKRFLKKK